MPAALTIEGMLQTLALLIYSTMDHSFEKAYIVDIKTKLLSSITEVDSEIIYDAKLSSFKRGISKGTVEVFLKIKKMKRRICLCITLINEIAKLNLIIK